MEQGVIWRAYRPKNDTFKKKKLCPPTYSTQCIGYINVKGTLKQNYLYFGVIQCSKHSVYRFTGKSSNFSLYILLFVVNTVSGVVGHRKHSSIQGMEQSVVRHASHRVFL